MDPGRLEEHRWKQEDHKFVTSLHYTSSSSSLRNENQPQDNFFFREVVVVDSGRWGGRGDSLVIVNFPDIHGGFSLTIYWVAGFLRVALTDLELTL